jgi:hypothetical protein
MTGLILRCFEVVRIVTENSLTSSKLRGRLVVTGFLMKLDDFTVQESGTNLNYDGSPCGLKHKRKSGNDFREAKFYPDTREYQGEDLYCLLLARWSQCGKYLVTLCLRKTGESDYEFARVGLCTWYVTGWDACFKGLLGTETITTT